MAYAVAMSQEGYFAFNVTHGVNNVTYLGDDNAWDSWMSELNANPIYRVAIFIRLYYLFILSAIGVPCNMLSFLVLRRIKPLTSALLIMMLLAVADSLNLVAEASNRVMSMIHVSFSNTECCVLMTARYLVQYMPIWLVVLLTLERVVAVCFPMKAAHVCTISNARRFVVILFIMDVLMCMPNTFIYEAKRKEIGLDCPIKLKYVKLNEQLMMADSVFFVFIPLTLISFCNTSIIIKLRMSRGVRQETTDSSISEENKRQNKSVTVMLLAVSLTTIICLGPNLGYSFIGHTWDASINPDPSTYARQRLIIWIIFFLTRANNSVNFFLYILSGRRFRTEFHDMVTSWFGIFTFRR